MFNKKSVKLTSTRLVIPIIILLFQIELPQAQDFRIEISALNDQGFTEEITFGMSPYASDWYDPGIDIYKIPGMPGPWEVVSIFYDNNIFWRLILGSTIEERSIWVLPHHWSNNTITISWDSTGLADIGSFTICDCTYGTSEIIVDMTQQNTYTFNFDSWIYALDIIINAAPVTENQSVTPGWNMIGLPLKVADSHYHSVYPNCINGTSYRFDGSTYNQVDTLELGKGYWLKFPEDEEVEITGGDFGTVSVDLTQGWNMVSGVSRPLALTDVSDPDGILIAGMLYGFDDAYVTSDSLFPGEGYWLYATNPGPVTFSLVGTYVASKRSATVLKLESYPSLQLSDASGANTELYFDVQLSDPSEKMFYSLPPLPPQGAFDARFEGDYRIAAETDAVIQIQPSDYPLTVTASNLSGQYALEELVNGKAVVKHTLYEGKVLTIWSTEVRTLRLTELSGNVPDEFILYANYPNPFNPVTSLRYDLPKQAQVTLTIYDLMGREVTQLVNTTQESGYRSVQWDATDSFGKPVSAGVYLYQIRAGEFVQTKKMVLLK